GAVVGGRATGQRNQQKGKSEDGGSHERYFSHRRTQMNTDKSALTAGVCVHPCPSAAEKNQLGSSASSSARACISGRRVFSEKSNAMPAALNSSGRVRVPPSANAAR